MRVISTKYYDRLFQNYLDKEAKPSVHYYLENKTNFGRIVLTENEWVTPFDLFESFKYFSGKRLCVNYLGVKFDIEISFINEYSNVILIPDQWSLLKYNSKIQ